MHEVSRVTFGETSSLNVIEKKVFLEYRLEYRSLHISPAFLLAKFDRKNASSSPHIFFMSDELQAVVIDIGSDMSKVGFAGDEVPKSVFRSLLGFPMYRPVFPHVVGKTKDVYIGDEAYYKAGVLYLKPLINSNGVITDRVDMDKVYHHIFYNELRVDPTEHAVLFTDNHGRQDARKNREKVAQVMFESFSVPSLFIEYSTTLAAYSNGKTTALVVDCGDSDVQVSVIANGYRIPDSFAHLGFGGRVLTDYLLRILGENAVLFNTRSNRDMARDIKEKLCYTAYDRAEEDSHFPRPNDEYTHRNGDTIVVGNQRFRCPEALFNPGVVTGKPDDGIHEVINSVIQKSDVNIRNELWRNIVLSGGSSLFNGFPERLERECTGLAPATPCIKVVAAPERKYAAWMGGSILGCLATFPNMVFSQEEYYSAGVGYMHRRMEI